MSAPVVMNEEDLTRQERREIRRNNGRIILDNRRSVRLIAELGVRPPKKRKKEKPWTR
jgi:hypothetical protein